MTLTQIDYYRDRPDRQRSRELDFGVWWRKGEMPWPVYRLTWVEATGEVILVSVREEATEILGVVPTEDELERRLEGWFEVCGADGSVEWVQERLR